MSRSAGPADLDLIDGNVSRNPRRGLGLAGLLLAAGLTLALVGCASKDAGPGTAAPGATYTGPQYLYNTVGSLTQLRNNRLQLVSGYGLVVGLDGTGSSEVPAALRQWLINEATKQGVGRQKFREILPLGPEELLASNTTAVVRVIGFIPPGTKPGQNFDLLVTAADTSTTSLLGGRLWTTSLSAGGANPSQLYLTPLAMGSGPIYLDPTDADSNATDPQDPFAPVRAERRRALVVSGGSVLEPRNFELALNQPSRTLAAAVADRINERYPKAPRETKPTANAISPLIIQLNVPLRYQDNTSEFVDLINHTYIDRSPGFTPYKARELADVLVDDPDQSRSVALAWKALGPNVATILRDYYTPQSLPHLRLTALEAGAAVGDERASEHLLTLADNDDPAVRTRVARALVALPRSIYGERALVRLLDDPVRSVRLAAYESLATNNHRLVERSEIRDAYGQLKLVIDRLPAQRPLIYLTQKNYPRLVIFDPDLALNAPVLARLWNNRLMIRRPAEDKPATLFYQYPDPQNPAKTRTDQHQLIPTVAALAYVLAHAPTLDRPETGYDLTYGQLADALYQLARQNAIPADVEIDRSALASLLEQSNRPEPTDVPDRPETAPAPPSPLAPPPPSTPTADSR